MNVMYRVAILILAVIAAILLVVAIYMYINKPIGYGITGIAFGYTRYSSVIKVAVENNKSESITVVAVFINRSQINNEPSASFPYPYPKLPVTIQPFSRTVLQIEGFDWKWSDPPEQRTLTRSLWLQTTELFSPSPRRRHPYRVSFFPFLFLKSTLSPPGNSSHYSIGKSSRGGGLSESNMRSYQCTQCLVWSSVRVLSIPSMAGRRPFAKRVLSVRLCDGLLPRIHGSGRLQL